MGVSRNAVSLWEKGGEITSANLRALAEKFGVSISYIDSGDQDAKPVQRNDDKLNVATQTGLVTVVPGGERLFQGPEDLPILGHVRAGEVGLFIDNGEVQGMTTRPKALQGVKNAYAVRVQDTSMFPAYEPDDLVHVNPFLSVQPGHNVVIQLHSGEAFVKRLVRRTDKEIRCQQWNPKKEVVYDPKKVRSIHRIVRPT